MLRKFAPALMILIAIQANAYPNEPAGFRGIPWGAEASAYGDELILASQKGDTTMYSRAGDKLGIGDAVLSDLKYVFYKGQLSSVMMTTTGIDNRRKIRDAFEAQFGTPMRPNRYLEDFLWDGPVTRIGLNCNTVSHRCTALIFSREMFARERADAKASAADKVQKDF